MLLIYILGLICLALTVLALIPQRVGMPPMSEGMRNTSLFVVMALLITIVGELQSWNVALQLLNLCLISAIMSLGVIAVAMMGDSNPQVYGVDVFFLLLLAAVFLMGTQSALFAPAKMGTIPELLDECP